MTSWFSRYAISSTRNAAGEPVTEILDRLHGTSSRFLGIYSDVLAIAMLEQLRAECAKGRSA